MSFLEELKELPRPRSLVEAASFSLEAVAARTRLRLLSGVRCEEKLERRDERLGLGLDLLLVATDAARRNATEANLYRAVRGGMNLDEAVADRLFDANDHPKPEIKKLLAESCRYFWLRNIFGREDTLEWFGSIKLQFGFTRRGFVENLPEWLMGYRRPTTVSLLLDDPYLASGTFYSLWNALLDYRNRQNKMPEARLRQVIKASQWTLPDWADELIAAARSKPHLSPSTTRGGSGGNVPGTCLSEPRLKAGTNITDARWEITLEGLADLELTDRSYLVSLSFGQSFVREEILRKQVDETYSNLDAVFEIPAAKATDGRVLAVLSDSQAKVVATQEVQLFDPDQDVIAFKQNGCLDNEFLIRGPLSGVLYTLLLRDDLKLAPASTECAALGDTGYRIARCSMIHGQTLRIIFDDGDELWSSQTKGLTKHQALPAGINPRLDLESPHLDELYDAASQSIRLKLSGIGGAAILSARWRSHSLWNKAHDESKQGAPSFSFRDFASLTVNTREEPILEGIPKHEAIVAGRVLVSLSIRINGGTFRTKVEWVPTVQGIMEECRGRTTFARHLGKRSYNELESGRYWIFPPVRQTSEEDDPPWCLFEGDRFVGTVRAGAPHRFRNLGAYGASITLRSSRFNTAHVQSKLITELADTGIFLLNDANSLPNSSGTLECWASPEMGDTHRLYYGTMHEAGISEAATERLIFTGSVALFDPFPSCPCDYLALAYEGVRVAAWWRTSKDGKCWSSNLANIRDDESARRAAFTMRWARLPILSASHFADVETFFRRFPDVLMREWLGPPKLHHDGRRIETENSDAWYDAVRTLIQSVQVTHPELTPDERRKLLTCMAREPGGNPVAGLLDSLDEIGRCDPILMGRLLHFWLASDSPPPLLREQVRTLLVQSIDKPGLSLELESFTGCDEYFLNSVLDAGLASVMNTALDPIMQANLKNSLTVAPFRKLLFLRIVETSLRPAKYR